MYKEVILNGYVLGAGIVENGGNITEEEYNSISDIIRNRPTAESGYAYRLKTDLTWELYELPVVEETTTAYTEEQLTAMTTSELKAICEELGISSSMTKANMVELIMAKQNA